MTPNDIARVTHEVNRAFCADHGDYSQTPWEEAPEWQRASALMGVQAILNNPATTPEMSHEGWSAQKIADGWTYGPTKDATLKQHPCLVPYAALPPEQRAKDAIFGGVVRALSVHLSETVSA